MAIKLNSIMRIKKPLSILLGLGFVPYAIANIVLYNMQWRLLYIPRPALNSISFDEVSFSNNDTTLRGWVINPGHQKALLYYGGNAEQIERNGIWLRERLPEYTTYLIPYRGYGRNPGQPREATLYQDAEWIYNQISHRHSEVSVIGRSLGTGVATHMAVSRPIEHLILVTPYDSIENIAKERYWMFPVSWLLHDKYLSWQRAPDIKARTLVLLSEEDSIVPRHHS